ncbi:EamA family transporter [Kiloniella sp. EL199]|uniref:EamA family transporter n=1 Tax=Kiloniella sp. EL199 TaxID=2107581 RepID=UPI000EA0CCB6|nr:EamA family transporter [Kiloniella sp. EL199]
MNSCFMDFGHQAIARTTDVVLLTPLTYSSILFSVLVGFLLFGEHLSWYTALGAIIIITGCLIGMGIYRKRLPQSQ